MLFYSCFGGFWCQSHGSVVAGVLVCSDVLGLFWWSFNGILVRSTSMDLSLFPEGPM